MTPTTFTNRTRKLGLYRKNIGLDAVSELAQIVQTPFPCIAKAGWEDRSKAPSTLKSMGKLSLSIDAPGDIDPHGVYVLEPQRVRTLDRQGRGGARVADFTLLLTSRLDPQIGEAAEDLTQAWEMAERIGQILESDVGAAANLEVTSVAALGTGPDGATYAHTIAFTATFYGG